MDYRYIRQLLERYWKCETTLEEEKILRTFFGQKDVPADLLPYRDLFAYEAEEVKADVLGDDFDERMLAIIEEPQQVKARVITMPQRLKPLFKAAAVVAIVITLSNAIQMSFDTPNEPIGNLSGYDYTRIQHGASVAKADSATIDTMKQSSLQSETNRPYMK